MRDDQRADPLPRSITVDLSTGLLRDLLHLSSSIGLDDDALGAPLATLVESLRTAVPSYRGLHLTIVNNSHPISLTAFLSPQHGASIKTSLRVGFQALGPGFDAQNCVVFYAATPGAFVDMAADFEFALDTRQPHPVIRLNPPRPERATDSTAVACVTVTGTALTDVMGIDRSCSMPTFHPQPRRRDLPAWMSCQWSNELSGS